MAVSVKSLLRRRGALVAAVTALAIGAALALGQLAIEALRSTYGTPVAFDAFGTRILAFTLPVVVGVFLCLWLLAPVAAELEMRFVVTRAVLAAAAGLVVQAVVQLVIVIVQIVQGEGFIVLAGTGLFVDVEALGGVILVALVTSLQYFVVFVPVVILFAMFQWQWLKNHPAKFDVAGILDV